MESLSGHPKVALLALVIVLAGCSGLSGEATPTETVTPAPVPVGDLNASQSDTAGSGLTAGTDFDTNDVLDRHREALEGRSYLLVERWVRTTVAEGNVTRRVVQIERTWVRPGQGYRYDIERRTDAGGNRSWFNRSWYADGTRQLVLVETAGGNRSWFNRSWYADGTRQLVLVETADGREILDRNITGDRNRFDDASADTIARFLSLQDATVSEPTDGRYLIEGNGSNHPEQTFTANNSATALVTESGTVTYLRARYDQRTRAGQERISYQLRVVPNDGEDLPRPAWLDGNVTTTDEADA